MRELNSPSACAPVIFRTIERLYDLELGTPGPLVHLLECWPGEYGTLLAESIRRKPAQLTVWMVNRILDTRPTDADVWLALLRLAIVHPLGSRATKADATEFLMYQAG